MVNTIEKDVPNRYYARLNRKFVLITAICSLLPLLAVGWIIKLRYSGFAESRMVEIFRSQAEHHRQIIELFLKERSSGLQLLAQTHSLDYLRQKENLQQVFETLNGEYQECFTDLGIIDVRGRHVTYVGPYRLDDRNYAQARWFKRVMEKGVYISDMFLGFRKVPHFVVAVLRRQGDSDWVLRATIDTEAFRALVEQVKIGRSGEVYLRNPVGVFQTSPRFSGKIMEPSGKAPGPVHADIQVRVHDTGAAKQIVAQAWLDQPRWLLTVRQDYAEAFYDVNHTNFAMLVLLHISALTILLVSFFTARHMIKVIRKRDQDAEGLNQQLIQASKLASIGELSAGVAHEINNPLAIIMTERQILLDMAQHEPQGDSAFMEQVFRSLSQVQTQLQRCKRITQNLLRFSRRTKSVIEEFDLNGFLTELAELMEREAGSSGIKFSLELDPDLPLISSDLSQLQQVFLNLITNAIDAHETKPYGNIRVRTHSDDQNKMVVITVSDTGTGIRPEHLDKVFDPFFTTKAVGKGTGLGLSLCHSMVKRLGGTIAIDSEPGEGTKFRIELPEKIEPNEEVPT